MRVLVTGGTGFLGKAVVKELSARGHTVRLLARATSNLSGLPEGVSVVRGDVTLPQSLDEAVLGCDALLHMAALVKVWVPERETFDRVNVGGLQNALGAARRAGVRLVYTSSFIALGPAGPEPADESRCHPGPPYRNDYERTKAVADQVAREAAARGDDVVLLYPGVIYGPGDLTEGNIVVRMLLDHLRGRLPGFVGPGDRLWSYAFVPDVAKGHVSALETGRRGERYILCGENATLVALFDHFRDLTGVAPPRRHLPYAVASLAGRLLWAWAELTGHPPLMTHEVVGVFREHWAFSSRKAETELGYRMTPLKEGLASTVAWLREARLV
jgi:farnesol dehydrogenase